MTTRQAYATTRMTPAGILADFRAKKARGAFWRFILEPVIAPADGGAEGMYKSDWCTELACIGLACSTHAVMSLHK